MLRSHRLTIKQALRLLEPEKVIVKQVTQSPFEKAVAIANEHRGIGISLLDFIDTLEGTEGFSHEEAVYGVTHCSINWKEEAVIAAMEMKNDFPYASEIEIREILVEACRFTGTEAAYGCRKAFY